MSVPNAPTTTAAAATAVAATVESIVTEIAYAPRPVSHRIQGFAFGAVCGVVTSVGHSLISLHNPFASRRLLLNSAVAWALNIGIFQELLHSRSAQAARTADFDPYKYGGSTAAAFVGSVWCNWRYTPEGKRVFSPRRYAATAVTTAIALWNYVHVANLRGVAVGELGDGTLAIDASATVLSAAVCGGIQYGIGGKARGKRAMLTAASRGALVVVGSMWVLETLDKRFH